MPPWPDTMLERHWGVVAARLTPLERGHTNESFAVDAVAGAFVIRRGWPGKPASQIASEERVLAALAHAPGLPAVPVVRPARGGASHARDDAGRIVHLFARCPGEPGPRYLAPGAGVARMREAMCQLAHLHAALAAVVIDDAAAPPWQWLLDRLERVRGGDLAALPEATPEVLARISAVLASACAPGPPQALHGDFHLGNLLWGGARVTGVVDFDETGAGSAASEAAMALFALARQPDEDRFTFDRELWCAGLEAYEEATGTTLDIDGDALAPVFCAYQVLIHLEAAQHGLWALEPGIGFQPCWAALTQGR